MAELTTEQLLQKCVDLAAEKKARDIVSLNLNELTLICDYFIIASASNTRQAQAIADNIEQALKKEGIPPTRIEGYREAQWILIDCGAVVIHIFLEEQRQYYDLERLWADAPKQSY